MNDKSDKILKEKPNVDDFEYQPYGYINALQNYIDKLEVVINNTYCPTQLLCERNDWYSYLTVGKEYKFIAEDEITYVVIDDLNNFQVIPKYYFKEITK